MVFLGIAVGALVGYTLGLPGLIGYGAGAGMMLLQILVYE